VSLATPSLHSVYRTPPRYEGALVLGISQSGKSPDIVSVLTDAREQGAVTAAMTNDPDSDLAVAAEHSLALHAGPERSVAATKTYTAELALVALLSAEMAGDGAMVETLGRIPAAMERTLQMGAGIAAAVERYRYMHACVVIGRGYNYATAFETALKIKELNYLIAEPYSSADFMHGPVALVEEAFPTMVIAPSGAMLEEMRKFAAELHTRGAEIIGVSDDPGLLEVARTPLRLPVRAPEWVSPLLSIIPGQLFAMHLAHARGYDVDRPRGLSKVTETR
jgi:glucosamine--fructose-6-phosphate aminotransferase (isomerizing)